MKKAGVSVQHLPYSIKIMLYMQAYQGGYKWLRDNTSGLLGRSRKTVNFDDQIYNLLDIKINNPVENLKKISEAFKNKKTIEEINELVKKFWSDYTKIYMYHAYCQYKKDGSPNPNGEGPGARKFMFCNFVINWQKFENEYRITPEAKVFNFYNQKVLKSDIPKWFFKPYAHKSSEDYNDLEIYLHPMNYWDDTNKQYVKSDPAS
jgi:hypothetical protein